jgi:cell division protein FtsW
MPPARLRQALLLVMLAMLGLGTVAVASASALIGEATYGHSLRFIARHALAIAAGLALGYGCLWLPDGTMRRGARWMFALSLIALVLVCVVGQDIGGARRWFRIGRLSVQPAEIAQLALIIYLADWLARRVGRLDEFWRGVAPPLAVTGVAAGLVLLQPDLGTAVVMGAGTFLMLGIANARWQHLAVVAAVAVVALAVLVMGEEYRRRRILAFLDPWSDPQGSGYQILQSYIALAGGGLVGAGVGGSLQKLFFLPSAHTDFIFAVIGEELGLIGTTAVIALVALWLTCGFRLAQRCQDLFSKLLICGVVGTIGLEAMVNMAVVTGLVPTKGLPLPLVSYGGTAMVVNLAACGLVMRVSRDGERAAVEGVADR